MFPSHDPELVLGFYFLSRWDCVRFFVIGADYAAILHGVFDIKHLCSPSTTCNALLMPRQKLSLSKLLVLFVLRQSCRLPLCSMNVLLL